MELSHRSQGIFFYVPIIIFGTLPWSAFLLKALKGGVEKRIPLFKVAEKHFLLIWIFFIFFFFSISSSELIPYIAPIFLPIAIFMGHLFRLYEDRNISLEEGRVRRFLYDLPIILQSLIFIALLTLPFFIKNMKLSKYLENSNFEKWWWLVILPILFQVMMIFLPSQVERRWRRSWFPTIAILSTLFLISIHFPIAKLLTPSRSAYPVSKAIHALLPPNQELFQFRTSLYGIDFYNKIRTPLVGRSGELEFGFNQLPPDERSHYHLAYDEFYQRCKENADIYCVTRYKENVEELKRTFSTLEILWDNGEFYLLRLRG
jgi:4-amino-4-deoxy-L-arabinose transferase-like glycosyltransferase